MPYLIMPLMERGSLLMYLRKEKDNLLMPKDTEVDLVHNIGIARARVWLNDHYPNNIIVRC